MIRLPQAWHEWNITEELGSGTSGSVYLAQKTSGEFSAVKVIRTPLRPDESELLLMQKLQGCPYIVSIEDYCIEENDAGYTLYIRMERLHPLPETLEEKELIKLGIHISSALSYCEKMKILHRDIKQANILVSDSGIYKLCDFGVARGIPHASDNLSIKGSYATMAPEVYWGRPYDHRADQYSLAMVMYRLANQGRDPFVEGDTFSEKEDSLRRRLKGDPIPPPPRAAESTAVATEAAISEAFSAILLKALSYDKRDRFRTAARMRKALIQCREGRYKTPRLLPWKRRLYYFLGAFSLVLLLILGHIYMYQNNICMYADHIDGIFRPGHIRMIDHLQRAGGSKYSSREIESRAKELYAKMRQYAAAGDYDSFSSLYVDTKEEDIISNYEDFAGKDYPNIRWLALLEEDDTYLVNGIAYQTPYLTFLANAYLYSMVNDKGTWKNNDSESAWARLDARLLEGGYYPAGYVLAKKAGRNTVMFDDTDYSYLSSDFIYGDDVDPYQVKFAWENKDGSIGLLLQFKNGGAKDYIEGVHVRLASSESGQALADENIDIHVTLPENKQVMVYKEIKPVNRKTDWDTLTQTVNDYREE